MGDRWWGSRWTKVQLRDVVQRFGDERESLASRLAAAITERDALDERLAEARRMMTRVVSERDALQAFIGRIVDRETVFWDRDEPGALGLYTAIDYTLTAYDCALVRKALAALSPDEQKGDDGG